MQVYVLYIFTSLHSVLIGCSSEKDLSEFKYPKTK